MKYPAYIAAFTFALLALTFMGASKGPYSWGEKLLLFILGLLFLFVAALILWP